MSEVPLYYTSMTTYYDPLRLRGGSQGLEFFRTRIDAVVERG